MTELTREIVEAMKQIHEEKGLRLADATGSPASFVIWGDWALPVTQVIDAALKSFDQAERIEELELALKQSGSLIIEFADLNGFRNLTDAELGKALVEMIGRINVVLDKGAER